MGDQLDLYVPVKANPARPGRRSRTEAPQRSRLAVEIEAARLAALEARDPIGKIERPKTRGDCVDGARPCPFVGCKHNLYLDVRINGTIQVNFPSTDIRDLGETCSLDVAAQGGVSRKTVASMMNLTRERVRQIERDARQTLRDTVKL